MKIDRAAYRDIEAVIEFLNTVAIKLQKNIITQEQFLARTDGVLEFSEYQGLCDLFEKRHLYAQAVDIFHGKYTRFEDPVETVPEEETGNWDVCGNDRTDYHDRD